VLSSRKADTRVSKLALAHRDSPQEAQNSEGLSRFKDLSSDPNAELNETVVFSKSASGMRASIFVNCLLIVKGQGFFLLHYHRTSKRDLATSRS
jgi:hypothetical protein